MGIPSLLITPTKSMNKTSLLTFSIICHLLVDVCLGQQTAMLPTIHFTSPTADETVRWSISSNALGECSIVIFKPVKKVYELTLDHGFAAGLEKLTEKNVFLNLKPYYGTPVPGGQEFSVSWCLKDRSHRVTLANIFRIKKKSLSGDSLDGIGIIRDLLLLYREQILKAKIEGLDGVATEVEGMAKEIIRPEDED